jgi:hypothetical protein
MTLMGQPAAVTPTAKKRARITGTKAVVLWGAFSIAGLFPPWYYPGRERYRGKEYRFILSVGLGRTNLVRLAIEWLCILVAAGAAWLFVRERTVPVVAAMPASGAEHTPQTARRR